MKIYKFEAPWCAVCQMISKALEPYADKITTVDISTDEGAALANKYGIKSVPAMLIENYGEVAELKFNATIADFMRWL